ncbi:VWA domain-containing protein [Rhodovulum sp. BSW8]|uniref:vWA domain-containing protein n=1 Tax=Rhodovulum sp. BSW8 TaxID=2259645 RepID=UPI000DE4CF9E|nr:VWA domain-containing protein [Rhodovulum sp. BSW8]RBO53823.1 VWA domain-containing protein [Rhodovulum sp. BSW8]
MIGVSAPLALALLPLALLPLATPWLRHSRLPRLDLRPPDGRSAVADPLLTGLGMVAVAALVLGIAGLHLKGGTVPHRGSGTNLVLLIDRSSSMDETFAGRAPDGTEESKSDAARRILLDFIGKRPDDRTGIAAFSTAPLPMLPLTRSRSAQTAAIAALDEPGLSQTDIGRGLALALGMMDGTTAAGSRAVLMVSDGAGVIAPEVQEALRWLAARQEVHLYWLYLRSEGAKSLFEVPRPGKPDTPQLRPERHLHLFLQRLGVPYRAFEAESPDAVARAVEEIGRMETRPILTDRAVPRRDLSRAAFIVAGAAALLLAVARGLERPWAPRTPLPPVRAE